MARKKMSQNQDKEDSAMEEKVESLKSLNSMLLKETVERRHQVDSLEQSKASLESALASSRSEKDELEAELTRLSEGSLRLDIERNVLVVFMAHQSEVFGKERAEIEAKIQGIEGDMRRTLKEKNDREREVELVNEKLKALGAEIEKERSVSKAVRVERDEFRAKLDAQINETKALGRKLVEAEKNEKQVREEFDSLKVECDLVVKEKKERESKIESLIMDKESLERSLLKLNDAVDLMRRQIEGITKEKEVSEEEKKVQTGKRIELEKAVSGLNETVDDLRRQEESLRGHVAELEKRCADGEERERDMRRQIDELVEEKGEKEKKLSEVVEGKSAKEKQLDEVLKELGEVKLNLDEVLREKSEVSEAKARRESEIVELVHQVADLKESILGLEDCCRVFKDEVTCLESELSSSKDSLERVLIERDEAMKGIVEEEKKGASLLEKIKVVEKSLEDNTKLVEAMKAESAKVRVEKDDSESRCDLLKKDIAAAENELAKARKELQAMKVKVETAEMNSNQILKVFRSTAVSVCPKDGSDVVMSGDRSSEETNVEIAPYIAELEAIKSAFKGREKALEDMKRQLDFFKNSEAVANKKKNFWTVISSASTIFAALSFAYATKKPEPKEVPKSGKQNASML